MPKKRTKRTRRKTKRSRKVYRDSVIPDRDSLIPDKIGLALRLKKKYNIVDVPFSKSRSRGTLASSGGIHFNYQNYSNVMNFLKNLKLRDTCFFKTHTAYLNLKIDKRNMKIQPIGMYQNIFLLDLMDCLKSNKRFIPIILNLETNDGNHANILLIDKDNKTIEIYEPHGSRTSQSVLGDVKGAYGKKIRLVKQFWRDILPEYNVVNAVDFRRGTHFQLEYDPEHNTGFCVTWSILFVHYRLLNPNIKLETLIKYISLKITTIKLLEYAKYIEDSVKHKI